MGSYRKEINKDEVIGGRLHSAFAVAVIEIVLEKYFTAGKIHCIITLFFSKGTKPSIHPSIIWNHLSFLRSQGELEPIPADIGRRRDPSRISFGSLSKGWHTGTNNHSCLQSQLQTIACLRSVGENLEYPEKIPTQAPGPFLHITYKNQNALCCTGTTNTPTDLQRTSS